MEQIILQGGGDHAKVVLDCLLEQRRNVVGIFDPRLSGELFGVKHFGPYHPNTFPGAKAIISIGDNKIRKSVAERCGHEYASAIHPTAIISARASIGTGVMILHRAIVQTNSAIGDHVILNTGCQVDHDCQVASFAHIGPGVVLCGTVSIGEGTFMGARSVVIPGKKIGKWSIIGAGSVVVRDIPDYSLAVGNPARVIKMIS